MNLPVSNAIILHDIKDLLFQINPSMFLTFLYEQRLWSKLLRKMSVLWLIRPEIIGMKWLNTSIPPERDTSLSQITSPAIAGTQLYCCFHFHYFLVNNKRTETFTGWLFNECLDSKSKHIFIEAILPAFPELPEPNYTAGLREAVMLKCLQYYQHIIIFLIVLTFPETL